MIKAGIVGFGYMGHFHLEKCRQLGTVEVTAICDIEKEKLLEGKKLGLSVHETIDEFLKEDLELVIIATQNQFHAPYSILALEAGMHVLCEKPVTLNGEELEGILAAAERNNRLFTVHQQRRFDRDYQMVSQVVGDQSIGKVHTIESRIMGERGVCFGWRADPEAGGGMLYDWGVHLIDQMLVMFPEQKVTSVQSRLCSVLTPAVDDYFELNLGFDHDLYAKLMVCTFSLEKLPRWFVFGDRGTLKLDDISAKSGGMARIRSEVRGFDSVIGKAGLGPSRTMAPLEPGYLEPLALPEKEEQPLRFWQNLAAAIEGREQPYVTAMDLRRQMQILDAAFLSSKRGEIIKCSI